MSTAPRHVTTRRVLRLWQYLEGRRTRPALPVLAALFDVTERTIIRDLQLLEELRFAVPPPQPENCISPLAKERYLHA